MLKREMYLSRIRGFYDSDLVKILVGIRRYGISVILKQIMNELKEKIIDEDKYYVFLDEIQKVEKFEEVVNFLRVSIDKADFSRNGIIHKNIIDWLLEEK